MLKTGVARYSPEGVQLGQANPVWLTNGDVVEVGTSNVRQPISSDVRIPLIHLRIDWNT